MDHFKQTERTTLRRLPKRGIFDRPTVYSILDEGLVCHIGFQAMGQTFVIPTGYGRSGDTLYVHGSAASRMLRTLAGEVDICVTVSILDGLVLARSAFHHSVNYRSVMIFGKARILESAEEKTEALRAFTEHVAPGRWADVRQPNDRELKATLVLAIALEEVSAKMRTGGPIDDDEDMSLPAWAGVLPLQMTAGEPIPDTQLPATVEQPAYVSDYVETRKAVALV
jgi:nitroimidazol reductase NimA-like FMN-containing flavoprotein (pyridoxamine 5'-phosphate oxidase superfamily)